MLWQVSCMEKWIVLLLHRAVTKVLAQSVIYIRHLFMEDEMLVLKFLQTLFVEDDTKPCWYPHRF